MTEKGMVNTALKILPEKEEQDEWTAWMTAAAVSDLHTLHLENARLWELERGAGMNQGQYQVERRKDKSAKGHKKVCEVPTVRCANVRGDRQGHRQTQERDSTWSEWSTSEKGHSLTSCVRFTPPSKNTLVPSWFHQEFDFSP
jgi:hypothetical protein